MPVLPSPTRNQFQLHRAMSGCISERGVLACDNDQADSLQPNNLGSARAMSEWRKNVG
jgi:hypothetical protein